MPGRLSGFALPEIPLPDKRQDVTHRFGPQQHPSVTGMDHRKIAHPGNPGAFHGHFAIVGAFQNTGKKRIKRHVPRNDTQGEIHRPKTLRQIFGRGAKFAPGASQNPTADGVPSERIRQHASVIGRGQHDHPTEVAHRVMGQISPQDYPAHRVGDKMNFRRRHRHLRRENLVQILLTQPLHRVAPR